MKKIIGFISLSFFLFFFKAQAFAHEAYVLTKDEFQQGLSINSQNPLAPLVDSSHWLLFLIISAVIGSLYCLAILWATTSLSTRLDKGIRRLSVFGPLTIRVVISLVFFSSAMTNSIFGPELSLNDIAYGEIIRILLFILSAMIIAGFLVEVAALISFGIFAYMVLNTGLYMTTYVNFLGEIVVLLLFGSRFLSIDKILFGKRLWIKGIEKFTDLEIPIVRILYGVALMYTAVTIKFQHQALPIEVYDQYNLKQFFKESASFIAAGAGLSEFMIGAFIFLGFAMRFTIIISLIFITLSLIYFGEAVWPHLMLYGISISLIINSADKFTIDRYFIPALSKTIKKIKKTV